MPPPPDGRVVGEGAVAYRQRAMFAVENDAAATAGAAGSIAGEGAVAHRQRTTVGNAAAATAGGSIAGEGAVAHRQCTML